MEVEGEEDPRRGMEEVVAEARDAVEAVVTEIDSTTEIPIDRAATVGVEVQEGNDAAIHGVELGACQGPGHHPDGEEAVGPVVVAEDVGARATVPTLAGAAVSLGAGMREGEGGEL